MQEENYKVVTSDVAEDASGHLDADVILQITETRRVQGLRGWCAIGPHADGYHTRYKVDDMTDEGAKITEEERGWCDEELVDAVEEHTAKEAA